MPAANPVKRVYPCRFGEYVLAGPLGDGGGAVDVWLALQGPPRHEIPRVIKCISPSDPAQKELLDKRFKQRAAIALRLQHATIATTFATGYAGDEFYIVEEFVDGKDLVDLPKREISVPMAVHICIQVARALTYVHNFDDLGLVHRDVAPANIRVGFNGEVKLLDFGLATSPTHAGLTRTGAGFGRTAYAAPEVLAGSRADRRSDLYSLGVVLWELLAKRNFLETKVQALQKSQDSGLPALAPSRWNASVSPELDAAVLRAIADAPAKRFARMEEFDAALRTALPRAFSGEHAVKTLISELPSAEADKAVTRARLQAAEAFLRSGTTETFDRPRRRRAVVAAVIACIAVVTAGGVAALMRWQASRENPFARAPAMPTEEPRARSVADATHVVVEAPSPVHTEVVEPPALETSGAARPRRSVKRSEKSVVRTEPAAAPTPHAEVARVEEAEAAFATGRFAEALKLSSEAANTARDPRVKSRAFYLWGSALLALGRRHEAEAPLKQALGLDPSNQAAAKKLELARQE